MCDTCSEFSKLLPKLDSSSFDFSGALNIANSLIHQSKLSLLAGDCELSNTLSELSSEKHYTVKHYLQCCECMNIYFIGGCIRGRPIFEKQEKLPSKATLNKTMWGRYGSVFQNR